MPIIVKKTISLIFFKDYMQYFQSEKIITTFQSLSPMMEVNFGSRANRREVGVNQVEKSHQLSG